MGTASIGHRRTCPDFSLLHTAHNGLLTASRTLLQSAAMPRLVVLFLCIICFVTVRFNCCLPVKKWDVHRCCNMLYTAAVGAALDQCKRKSFAFTCSCGELTKTTLQASQKHRKKKQVKQFCSSNFLSQSRKITMAEMI